MPSASSRALGAQRPARRSLPLQEQIYQRVRRAIAEGRLGPGERLPATRTLASELGIARGTVDAAYARLAGEGYLLARGPAGTIVAPALRRELLSPGPAHAAPAARGPEPTPQPLPFQMGLPALDLFPRTLWARLWARAAKRLGAAALAYPDPAGHLRLREAIAAYLAVSRGVACEPGQVMITGGYQAAVSLVARLLLRPGDKVWFEEPGYFRARAALEREAAQLVPIPIDEGGMDVDFARRKAPDARLAVVTPAHQAPLGTALSLVRRQALLAWAADAAAFIVEDDYDSEFHYVGRTLPALKSLDRTDRVIYAGSFSKTLFPGLCLGYLVLPLALVGAAAETSRTTSSGQAVLPQMVVADFLAEGHFARHLKRMRGHYAARRTALAAALTESFGAQADVALRAGGLHFLLRLAGGTSDTELMRRALAHRLAPTPLSINYAGRKREQGLLLGFTNIAETQARASAEALRRALQAD